MTDPFAMFDGAYVLGGLSAADRQSFEAHLETCDACLHQVASLRDVPGLLATVSADSFSLDAPIAPSTGGDPALVSSGLPPSTPRGEQLPMPADLLPNLLVHVRSRSARRRFISRTAVGLVAACVLVLAGTAAARLINGRSSGSRPSSGSSATVTNAFFAANISVTPHDAWDDVNLTCTYKSQRVITGNYIAVAEDATGRSEVVASWPAISGQTAVAHTPTTFKSGTITRVSILNARGQVLAQITV